MEPTRSKFERNRLIADRRTRLLSGRFHSAKSGDDQHFLRVCYRVGSMGFEGFPSILFYFPPPLSFMEGISLANFPCPSVEVRFVN